LPSLSTPVAHPKDCIDRSDDAKARFFDDDEMLVTEERASSMFAPPVPDERSITDHCHDELPIRCLAGGPRFHDEKVTTLATESLQVRLRNAIDNLVRFHDLRCHRERLSGSTCVNRKSLRYLSCQTKDALALAMPSAAIAHPLSSSATKRISAAREGRFGRMGSGMRE
jgi:hypothetical protein